MKRLLSLAALAVSAASMAVPYYNLGSLTTGSLTFDNPGGSSLGSGIHYYDVVQFTVDTAGAYTFEMSSLNTNQAGQTSNALDTFLRLYTGSFNPAAPGAGTASNDDYGSPTSPLALTVLPGPYTSAGLTNQATGFQGTQPSSRMLNINLSTGTQYFLVLTSFRETTYVPTGTNPPEGGATGNYWYGIDGPGTVNVVPEPATMAVLGLGALAAIRRRRSKKA